MTYIATPQGILRLLHLLISPNGDMEILNAREYNIRAQEKSLGKFQAHREFDSAGRPRQGLDPAGVGTETTKYKNVQTGVYTRASFQELLRF